MNLELVKKAQKFAHEAHDSILQKRKYTGEPYWVHTDEVAATVTEALKNSRPDGILLPSDYITIAVAHCHDIYEDVTPHNEGYVKAIVITELGREVHFGMVALTDVYTKEQYPDMNRRDRKKAERERLGTISNDEKTVKLADLISNTRSIVKHDPDFARVYIKEKMDVLSFLVGGNTNLLARASQQVIEGYEKLGLTIPTLSAPSPA